MRLFTFVSFQREVPIQTTEHVYDRIQTKIHAAAKVWAFLAKLSFFIEYSSVKRIKHLFQTFANVNATTYLMCVQIKFR